MAVEMPTFTHVDVEPNDNALINAIFELGKEAVLPHYAACTPYAHPTRGQIREAAGNPNKDFIAVYADGELRGAVAFDNGGNIRLWIGKPWLTPEELETLPEGTVDPRGIAQKDYIIGVIESRKGRAVSQNKNPGAAALEAMGEKTFLRGPELGIDVEPT